MGGGLILFLIGTRNLFAKTQTPDSDPKTHHHPWPASALSEFGPQPKTRPLTALRKLSSFFPLPFNNNNNSTWPIVTPDDPLQGFPDREDPELVFPSPFSTVILGRCSWTQATQAGCKMPNINTFGHLKPSECRQASGLIHFLYLGF